MRTSNIVRQGFQGTTTGQPKESLWQVLKGLDFTSRATRIAISQNPLKQRICLQAKQLWSETVQHQTRITCENGRLWVTQSGDLNDTILRAGEEMTVGSGAHVVITTLGGPATFWTRILG